MIRIVIGLVIIIDSELNLRPLKPLTQTTCAIFIMKLAVVVVAVNNTLAMGEHQAVVKCAIDYAEEQLRKTCARPDTRRLLALD